MKKLTKSLKNFPNSSENFINPEKTRQIGQNISQPTKNLNISWKTAELRGNHDFTSKIGGFRVTQHFSATTNLNLQNQFRSRHFTFR